MEKIGINLVLLALLITNVYAHKENINDLDINDANWSIKNVYRSIKYLIQSNDTLYEDKTTLKSYEESIFKLKLMLDKTNGTHDDRIVKIFDQVLIIQDGTDLIEKRSEDRKKVRLSEECAEEVRQGNYKAAVRILNLINDHSMVAVIVDKSYNGNKDNFKSIRDFGDEIPSISLSFELYKSLKSTVDVNQHFDKEIGLLLMEFLKKNIIDQSSVDQNTKSEAIDLLDEVKIPVKTWIVEKFGYDIQEEKQDEESFELAARITYGINGIKFFREISANIVENNYPKYNRTFYERLLKLTEKEMRSVPRIILYNAIYEHIIETEGMISWTIHSLIMLQKGMKKADEDERDEFKISTNQLWKSTPQVKYAVVRKLKIAFLNGFFNEEDIDTFTVALINSDKIIFQDVIWVTIHEIYGKMNTIELIDMIRASSDIRISLVGCGAVVDCMKRKGDLEVRAKNVGALIKLEQFVDLTRDMDDFESIDINYISYLTTIEHSVTDLKEKIYNMFEQPVSKGNYTNDEYKLLCEQIYAGYDYWHYISTLCSSLYKTFNTEKLLDYVLSLPTIQHKIVGLKAMDNEIPYSSGYLFVVAQNSKLLTDSDGYEGMEAEIKGSALIHKNALPSSVHNAVYSKEVLIKNRSWGGEYLYIPRAFNLFENMTQVFTQVTWKVGNDKWALEYTGEGNIYKIKNIRRKEYLFATEDRYNYDQNSRRVFTSAQNQSGRDKWRLLPSGGGVHIKNVFYKEYLFAGKFLTGKENRPIFTYIPRVATSNADWTIEDATMGY